MEIQRVANEPAMGPADLDQLKQQVPIFLNFVGMQTVFFNFHLDPAVII
jgi:hypothetical protein